MDDTTLAPRRQPAALSRSQIRDKALAFDISAPLTEEEFEDGLQALGAYLLVNTKWDASFGQGLPKKIPVVSDVPLVCRGAACDFHSLCPVMARMTERQKEELEGTLCRADRLLGVQLFADIAKDLDISPEQTIDLLNAANMVRLMIYRRRIDWKMSIEGITISPITAVNQKSGEAYEETKAHPLIREAERVDKMIESAQKSLVASRKDRMNLAAQLGRGQEVLKRLFSQPLDQEDELAALEAGE